MASSYRAVAAKVAESKRLHPDQFCPAERCLWRTGGGRCPRHPAPTSAAAAPPRLACTCAERDYGLCPSCLVAP